MSQITLTIDENEIKTNEGSTVLDACRENGIDIPVLCDFKGLKSVGACRMCIVEIEGSPRLFPACTTPAVNGQVIYARSERIDLYRRMVLELLFSEKNHVCSVCVANNNCELQTLAQRLGMDRVRFPYLFQKTKADLTHPEFTIDHDRCILCGRCVRVCDEVEGAHTWDLLGRGHKSRVISDFDGPWGESDTCTSCGKCVEVCPTGALWRKGMSQGNFQKTPERITDIVEKRKANAS